MKSPATILALVAAATLATSVSAQVLDWLPISDLPLSTGEASGMGGGPGMSAMCLWDPDGDGPLPQRLVVTGALYLTIPGADHVAYLDESGWHGLSYPTFTSSAFSMTTYRSPGATHDDLYIGRIPMLKHNGTAFSEIGNVTGGQTFAMSVGDPDGDGPLPPMLYLVNASRVYQWDGTTITQLTGGDALQSNTAGCMWDPDGPGPLVPRMVVASRTVSTSFLYQWGGTGWSKLATLAGVTTGANNRAYRLTTINFGADGPGYPELVAAGSFGQIGPIGGNTNLTGPLVVYRNNTWTGLCDPIPSGKYIVDAQVFDPDAQGPLPSRLIIGGDFTAISGVTARNLAYLENGTWNAFPPYWGNGVATSLLVSSSVPYSDSPQLMVCGVNFRPTLGRFALSGGPAGISHNPDDDMGPLGRTATVGVVPAGDELTFRWFKGDVALNDGATSAGSILGGVYSPRLTITNLAAADVGQYRVLVGNAFGTMNSTFATIGIGCPADFNHDNGVDIFDYLDFVQAFSDGSVNADFNQDSVIDFFDYLDFVQAFSVGC